MKGWRKYAWEMLGILIGSAFTAASFNMFIIPNKIAAGGISGLGVILFHLFEIPVGATVFLANIPLFLLAWIFMGWKFVGHSLAGSLFFPLMLEITGFLPLVTGNLFLASIFGGIGSGIGLGIVFRSQGSTGGTAIAAQLINHFWGLGSGLGLIIADFLIVILAGIIFGPELAMFALISLFISSKFTDLVQEGFAVSRAALIISSQRELIAAKIMEKLERGATFLDGRGAYTGEEKGIILCIIPQSQVSRLKKIVKEIDPGAFVIVSSVSEVLGEGFQQV
ncbi:MAG TPA: YitT family protein [Firmicutes bacterium]|nr:YitT family protein [Bacillota bacterium]